MGRPHGLSFLTLSRWPPLTDMSFLVNTIRINLMLPLGREIAIEHVHDECKRRCLAEGHFCILQGYDRTLTIDRAKAI